MSSHWLIRQAYHHKFRNCTVVLLIYLINPEHKAFEYQIKKLNNQHTGYWQPLWYRQGNFPKHRKISVSSSVAPSYPRRFLCPFILAEPTSLPLFHTKLEWYIGNEQQENSTQVAAYEAQTREMNNKLESTQSPPRQLCYMSKDVGAWFQFSEDVETTLLAQFYGQSAGHKHMSTFSYISTILWTTCTILKLVE